MQTFFALALGLVCGLIAARSVLLVTQVKSEKDEDSDAG